MLNRIEHIVICTSLLGSLATITAIQSYPVIGTEIDEMAEKFTVLIQGPASPGSGVIISKQNNTYTVLTAAHVVEAINPQEEAYTITNDQKYHPLDTNSVKKFSGYDLALVEFTSNQNYQVAEIGNSDRMERLMSVMVAGFPLPDPANPQSSFFITQGQISSIEEERPDGYHLGYTSATKKGMSGGPVLNAYGQLIAIHGRASGHREQGKDQGFNYGIPVNLFQAEAKKAGIELNLQLATTSPNPTLTDLPSTAPRRGVLHRRPPVVESTGPDVAPGTK